MPDDMTLLREYSRGNSEQAFAALVSRHVNLVYSVALRDVHDPHLAEDITQAVFVILARKAESFNSKIVLSGWLCRTARYASANALTIQRRRHRREQEAYMQSVLNEPEPDAWTQIAPLLGDAMEQLGQKDHDAVVLRFFEGKSFQEVGTALGATENAAKKRVACALEKLRKFFRKHGIVSTTTAIAVALSANSVQAAPTILAKTATAVALTKGATAPASTLTVIKGALKIMAWTKAKTVVVIGAGVLLATGLATSLTVHRGYLSGQQNFSRLESDFPRSSWTFAGYADPASALETVFWAQSQGNGKMYVESMTPDLQQRLQQQFGKELARQGISLETFFASGSRESVRPVTGFRIWGHQTVSNELLLRVWIPGKDRNATFKMKRIGDSWKLDEEFLPDY